jgi:hypothetical protein
MKLQENGTVTVAMDGNFGLVRKFNSGNSLFPPLLKNVYFLDNDTTQSFMDSYEHDKARDRVSA